MMKFVATKTADQLDLQALHPGRGVVGQPAHRHRQSDSALSCRSAGIAGGGRGVVCEPSCRDRRSQDLMSCRLAWRVIEDLAGDGAGSMSASKGCQRRSEFWPTVDSSCERLMSVPGIGPIISSAMVAAIGAGDCFSKGRDFAAWLGSSQNRCRPVTAPSWARYPSAVIATVGFVSVQAAWVVLIKPNSGSAMGSSLGSRRPKSGCTATCWRLRWPTSSLASPGVYWLAVEASRCGRWKQRPSLRDPYSAPMA